MPLARRMNVLRELFHLRVGPGAATLPRNVTRIHLIWPKLPKAESSATRIFWHDYLPRLKYYNPSVSMTTEQTDFENGPVSMTIFFTSKGPAKTAATDPAPEATSGAHESGDGTSSETLDIRRKRVSEIFKALLENTGGKEVEPTPEEKAQLTQYRREAVEKAEDSKEKKATMLKLQEEKRLEQQAKEAAAMKV